MLTTQLIRNPIDQTEPSENVSDRFSLINTRSLIALAEKQGFRLASVKYPRGKNAPHALHRVTMDMPGLVSDRAERPQLIIQNAHNGTSTIRLMAGVFRLICSNGLIAGDTTMNIRLRHVGLIQSEVEESFQIAASSTLLLDSKIDAFKSKKLEIEQREQFVLDALAIRADAAGLSDDEKKRLVNSQYNQNVTNRVRRIGDQGLGLWEVFNRVQEKLVRIGGISYLGDDQQFHTLRAVNQIQANTKLNQALWQLAEGYAA